MTTRTVALVVPIVLVLAGCAAPATVLKDANVDLRPEALLSVKGANYDGIMGYFWSGSSGKNASVEFDLAIPEGFWQSHVGAVEASVAWAHDADASFVVTITGSGGSARGTNGWYASVALIENAAPGTYKVEVSGSGRSSSGFDGVIQVDARPKVAPDGHSMLPNLVTIPPSDIRIQAPDLFVGLPVAKGCGFDESAEHRAMRCLRVSNGVGNIGEGPLEVRLALTEAAKAPAGMGFWMQRIHLDDGKVKEVPVGNAVFHATHGHWHYAGLARFELYHYDLEEQKRGDTVGKGNKNGFCFFDIGLVKLGLPGTTKRTFSGDGCLIPQENQGPAAWYMGLSPGWFDFYVWSLPDQYVEISGVPDGVYELVSTANGMGTLIETDKTDNSASAVIELKGDQVKTLKAWADFKA